jgi:hypothetical protein
MRGGRGSPGCVVCRMSVSARPRPFPCTCFSSWTRRRTARPPPPHRFAFGGGDIGPSDRGPGPSRCRRSVGPPPRKAWSLARRWCAARRQRGTRPTPRHVAGDAAPRDDGTLGELRRPGRRPSRWPDPTARAGGRGEGCRAGGPRESRPMWPSIVAA